MTKLLQRRRALHSSSAIPIQIAFICLSLIAGMTSASEDAYDLVINNGRVIDPQSGLDAARSIGIRSGKIAAVSRKALSGAKTIDAGGTVVGPGFIDLHAHGGTLLSSRLQAFDGVTTTIEAEVGQLPVSMAYEQASQAGRVTNFGWTASWGLARMQVLADIQPDGTMNTLRRGTQDPRWQAKASPEELKSIISILEENLNDGALGIGLINGYAPDVAHEEILRLSHLAAKHRVPIMTHPRYWGGADPGGDIASIQEVIANAIVTGAHWYVCHLSLATVPETQEMIAAARKKGAHIDVEVLVAETGSTFLGAEFLSPENLPSFSRGFKPSDILYFGKPIPDEAELIKLRAEDPSALIFLLHRDSENNLEHRATQRQSFELPGTILASDGMPWQDRSGRYIPGDTWPLPDDAWAHPRSQATFTRFLQLWVRQWQEFTLMDAFTMGAYNPARALEMDVPAFKYKGRIQVGADADLIIFDLSQINVRATLQNPLPQTEGIRWVIVNGVPVIAEGKLDPSVTPGRAIRRDVLSRPAS